MFFNPRRRMRGQDLPIDRSRQMITFRLSRLPDTQYGPVSIDHRSLTPGNTQQYNVGIQRQLDHVTTGLSKISGPVESRANGVRP